MSNAEAQIEVQMEVQTASVSKFGLPEGRASG
jgi:hypothetical protein